MSNYKPEGKRTRIVIDEYAFPTDVYTIQSQMGLHGLDWRSHLLTVKSTHDKAKQFDMAHEPTFARTAGALQIGTPPILSMYALQASLEMFHRAGLDAIREKSLKQTRFLMELVKGELAGMGFDLATPDADERRGGHVAVAHPEAARINKALKQAGIVPDFRPPDIIRLAPIALYTRYEDIAQLILGVKSIMEREAYLEFPNIRDVVA